VLERPLIDLSSENSDVSYSIIRFVLSQYFFQSNLLCEVNRTGLTDMGAEERIHIRQYEEDSCCCVAGLLSGRGRS
jgi:hypothetical protein